jgi:hypothetical protein
MEDRVPTNATNCNNSAHLQGFSECQCHYTLCLYLTPRNSQLYRFLDQGSSGAGQGKALQMGTFTVLPGVTYEPVL